MKNQLKLYFPIQTRESDATGNPLPDDVFEFLARISNKQLDGHYSRMSESTLMNYSDNIKNGIPLMIDHQEGIRSQIGMFTEADYKDNVVEAVARMLRDTDDTPDSMKVNEFIRRISAGLYRGVSVGFRAGSEICDICEKDIWTLSANGCQHVPGRTYDGTVCTYEVRDAHLREISLVSTPSNTETNIIDTRSDAYQPFLEQKQDGDKTPSQGQRGDALASYLNEQIGDENREETIGRMASEAGIETNTVNQILNGSINCPPMERLEGFARALDVSVDMLIERAGQDGCNYEAEAEEDRNVLIAAGLKYRNTLIEEAIRAGVRGVDNFNPDEWTARLRKMDTDTIIELTKTWKRAGDEKWGTGGRRTVDGNGKPVETGGTDLVLPEILFV